jgi:hypothetical protein
MTEEELKRDNSNLKRQIEVLNQKLAVYEDEDLEREGYYALKFWVRQQVDIVKDFKLEEEIKKNPKDDKFYDRVKALGEGLKGSITDLKILRTELRITQKEDLEDTIKRKERITPESISNVLGNTAGQPD